MNKPIQKFDDINQLIECAKYYEELLGLQDWNIAYKIADDMNESNNAGEVTFIVSIKCAIVKIKNIIEPSSCFRTYQEEILIHELLHCKFIYDEINDDDCVEAQFFYLTQHQLLEDMAKAIFMARYNLTKDCFMKSKIYK